MVDFEILQDISIVTPTKIVLLVLDGLGGIPHPDTGQTELETAKTPHFDRLAQRGTCGLVLPVARGITPGSGPGHLALFGYDPFKFVIGRGVLETLGIGFNLQRSDVAARANFCTVDGNGLITDRRAGRIATKQCVDLCHRLNQVKVKGSEVLVSPVREHRFTIVFRGNNLNSSIADTDPQRTGLAPKEAVALSPMAQQTAKMINDFIAQAQNVLANEHPANMLLLRGISMYPDIPTISEVYKLNPAAIAMYPMYQGLAKLVGMKILGPCNSLEEEFDTLERHYDEHDFFFVHVKGTDSAGEDGDFNRKVRVIEEVDAALPSLLKLNPDVIVVTGDHSTPAVLKGHSWHPVPFLLHSQWCRPDEVSEFSERGCAKGSLGTFPGADIMSLAMANALKLTKFGA